MTSTTPTRASEDPAIASALAQAFATVRRNAATFAGSYPDDTTRDGRYPLRPAGDGFAEGANLGWTTSFWPGALARLRPHRRRRMRDERSPTCPASRAGRDGEDLDTHDLGFLYTLSCVAAWRHSGDADARRRRRWRADHLMTRVLEPAGIIQAWGDLSDPAAARAARSSTAS